MNNNVTGGRAECQPCKERDSPKGTEELINPGKSFTRMS